MKRWMATAVVLACVASGCASADEVRTGLDSGDGSGQSEGENGERANGEGDGSSTDRSSKEKSSSDRRSKKRPKRQLEVRLRNVVGEIGRFSSPSTNIGCRISDNGVRCDIGERNYRPPRKPKKCNLDYGNAFAVGNGEPGLECVGDTVLGARTVLPYGTATRVGKYGCKSRRDGMRCYNLRTGRGFLVSRDLYEFY